MFIVAFVIVIFYQLYKRKSGDEDSGEGDLVKSFAKNKRLTPKAKADLNEIEKMMKQLGTLGDGVKNLSENAKKFRWYKNLLLISKIYNILYLIK